jgi:type 1 fimbria pilin
MKFLGIMKMNKILGFSLLAASVATSFQATAASTDLTITGEIIEGTCSVTLGNNGMVSFGDIPNASLKPTGVTNLADKTLDLDIVCPGLSLVAFNLKDNRHDTVYVGSDPSVPSNLQLIDRYGLNVDASDNPIGFYGIGMTAKSLNSINGSGTGKAI